jgi:hypothetical protein
VWLCYAVQATDAVASLLHARPDGSTFAGEDFSQRIADARLQFGAIGIVSSSGDGGGGGGGGGGDGGGNSSTGANHGANQSPNTPSFDMAFEFPGSEGDRTYICCQSPWANRSHPFVAQPSLLHNYTLLFESRSAPSYADAVAAAWRGVFDTPWLRCVGGGCAVAFGCGCMPPFVVRVLGSFSDGSNAAAASPTAAASVAAIAMVSFCTQHSLTPRIVGLRSTCRCRRRLGHMSPRR